MRSFRPYRVQACAALLAVLCVVTVSGCAGGAAGSTATVENGLAAGGAQMAYAIVQGTGYNPVVQQFSINDSSTVISPAAELTGPTGTILSCLATDSAGAIYVGGQIAATGQGVIWVYPAGATNATVPVRTILGGVSSPTLATFGPPQSIRINSAGTLAILSYNLGSQRILTLPASSNGAVAPSTLITGSQTQLLETTSLDIDANGKIYVTNISGAGTAAILEFAPGSTGNVAPSSSILTGKNYPSGVAVDAKGTVYTTWNDSLGVTSLVSFAAGANGAATPASVVTGFNTSLTGAGPVQVDVAGNIYVENDYTATKPATGVLVFAPGSTGNVAPDVVSTLLSNPPLSLAIH